MDAKETITYLYQHGHILQTNHYRTIVQELTRLRTELAVAKEALRWIPVSEPPKKEGYIVVMNMKAAEHIDSWYWLNDKSGIANLQSCYTHWHYIIPPGQALPDVGGEEKGEKEEK